MSIDKTGNDSGSATTDRRAESVMNEQFRGMREESFAKSLPEVQAWLRRVDAQRTAPVQHAAPPSAVRLLDVHRGFRRHMLAAGIAGVLVAVACIPVKHVETVGYVIAGRITMPPRDAVRELLAVPGVEPGQVSALGEVTHLDAAGHRIVDAYVGSGEAVVDGVHVLTPTSKFAIVIPEAALGRAHTIAASVRSLGNVDSLEVREMSDTVRTPAIRAAMTSMRLEWRTDLPEHVVEKHVREQLAQLKMQNVTVDYVTSSGGERRIILRVDGEVDAEQERRVQEFLKATKPRSR